jgi:uroporphyrinogen decarboxylase
MTSRQRVQLALDHKESDRVPVDFGTTNTTSIHRRAYENLKSYLGLLAERNVLIAHKDTQSVIVDEEVLQYFRVDTRGVWLRRPNETAGDGNGESYTDEWGVEKRWTGLYFDTVTPPLRGARVDDIPGYPWPNPDDPLRFKQVATRIEELDRANEYAIVLDPTGSVPLGQGLMLRGYEDFFSDLLVDTKFAVSLMDRLLEYQITLLDNVADLACNKIDVVKIADDLGTQDSLLVSPDLYRRFIKPRHKELVDLIKRRTRAKVMLHSDGNIFPLIRDFIEIGVDIINPIQAECRDIEPRRLKATFGKDICFWGGISQKVLAAGKRQEVETEIRKSIDDLAAGGGYVLACVHNVQPDVPPEGLCQLFDLLKK